MEEKAALKERLEEEVATRNAIADRLIEKWSNKKGLGLDGGRFDKIYESSPRKARNLAVILENEEKHLRSLTETQISNAFQATPQTIIKVIRLGYPNSIRGDVFTEIAMTTVKDSIYKIETTYDRTKRGATSGNVMYESPADRYASEIESVTVSATATANFTGTLAVAPIRPYTVTLFLNGYPIASDNGSGVFVGTGLSTVTPSTIVYEGTDAGDYDITFASALTTADTFTIRWNHNSEVSTLYGEQGQVNVNLVALDFRANPYPIGFSWSKMTEYYMESALKNDAEEVLITAGSDELKKSLDFQALRLGYSASKWTAAVEFDTDWSQAGSDSDFAHTQSVVKSLRNASQKTYDSIMRGGEATSYVCGPKAATYLTAHKGFIADNTMPTVGAYKFGTLNGIPLYQAPTDIVPTNEIMCVYKNNREEANDAALVTATFVPLYKAQTLEYSSFHKETALAFFGDMKIQNAKYVTRVSLKNLA
jgi:hypothetical protein